MTEITKHNYRSEKAVLVGLIQQGQDKFQLDEYLDELAFLAETAGAETVKRFWQKLDKPDPKTFVGSGKVNEIRDFVKEEKVDVVIFDDELSGSQIRNIEKIINVPILDRTDLILEIFASRARTAHAKTQVELARYQYILPRLGGMWTHLERQRGGTGTRGGAGEKEIETDRRIVRDKIALLKKKLKEIDKQMTTQRKGRGEMVKVALVGYTNVGKSTLMNLLTKSNVFAENKLFATLDTTVRKIVFENIPFLISDTVGFIRKLPHDLVESFKSTLDEVREADILIHVVDISHPHFEDQINVVNETLKELGAQEKPTLMVFNKIDAFQYVKKDEDDLTPVEKHNLSLDDLKKTWMSMLNGSSLFISATQRENIDELRQALIDKVKEIHYRRYPHNTVNTA